MPIPLEQWLAMQGTDPSASDPNATLSGLLPKPVVLPAAPTPAPQAPVQQDAPELAPNSGFLQHVLDNLAQNFQNQPLAPATGMRGHNVPLTNFLSGLTSGWSRGRVQDMKDQASLNDEMQAQQDQKTKQYDLLQSLGEKARLERVGKLQEMSDKAKMDEAGLLNYPPEAGLDASGQPLKGTREEINKYLLSRNKPQLRSMDPLSGKLGPLVDAEVAKGQLEQYKALHGNSADATTLTPEALDSAALLWQHTHILPPLGLGKSGLPIRKAILDRAAEPGFGLNPTSGPAADVAANAASYKSDAASLGKLQQLLDASSAFSETATKNADLMMDKMGKIPDTNSPWLNAPLRLVSTKGMGSADLAAFNTANAVVVPEFQKLLANPTMAGQMTDSQRKEVENIVSKNANFNQMIQTIGVLKKDAQNKLGSYQDQIDAIKGRIKGGSNPDLSSGKSTWIHNPDGTWVRKAIK